MTTRTPFQMLPKIEAEHAANQLVRLLRLTAEPDLATVRHTPAHLIAAIMKYLLHNIIGSTVRFHEYTIVECSRWRRYLSEMRS